MMYLRQSAIARAAIIARATDFYGNTQATITIVYNLDQVTALLGRPMRLKLINIENNNSLRKRQGACS